MSRYYATMLAVLIFTISVHSFADTTKSTRKDGFTLNLGSEWTEIPKNVLTAYRAQVKRMVPNLKVPVYHYGFQLAKNKQWFTYPYILVSINSRGRVPESQLKNYRKFQQSIEKAQKKSEGLISGAKTGVVLYDDKRHMLINRMTANYKKIGTVKAFIAIALTEKGSINIFSYSLSNEFEKYAPVFLDIMKSIKVSDPLAYKPRMLDNIPVVSSFDWKKIMMYAIIGAIIGLLISFFRKKKQ